MDLLADESVDFPIIKWLRERGHDIVAIADSSAGASDMRVLQLAIAQGRVLLTFDRHYWRISFSTSNQASRSRLRAYPNNLSPIAVSPVSSTLADD